MPRSASRTRWLLAAGTTLSLPAMVQAQTATTPYGTRAGFQIDNQATATYTVNGSNNSTSSNTASLVVDRKVNLTVVLDQSTTTKVNAGDQNAAVRFKVTNNTNATQDFRLFAHQTLDFPIAILADGDDYDVTGLKAVVDNGDGIYDPATDTQDWVDELAPDASKIVFVVGNVPSAAGQHAADVALETAVAAGGATGTKGALLLPTDLNILNQDLEIDNVFADNDNDGLLGPDIVRNGRGWAYGSFELRATSLDVSVVKSATVLSDGVNLVNPKAIPGAVVQYCLTVRNATLLTAAANVTLTDAIPPNTTYVPGSIQVGGIGTGGICLTGGLPVADNGSTVGLYGGSYNAATRTVTATIPLLAGGTSLAASFQVTIN